MSKFDVFLAQNSNDKPQVKVIARELKRRSLKPWLDVEQIQPGQEFQDVIQQVIPNVKTAAIFIGPEGLGKWQVMELRSICLTQAQLVNAVLTQANLEQTDLRRSQASNAKFYGASLEGADG